MKELSKAYEPQKYEDSIYSSWEKSGFFNPDVCVEKGICSEDAKPFTISLPPPNATGKLHIGHAMMLAIEDLMIRHHRMKGDRALWIPGTDHAAIATNAIVEKELVAEGKTKHDLGREKYVERVKEYISKSQENIRQQVRKMGSSLDWSREAYTWDEERNLAVRTMFKKMYDDGLIYRGHRIVNWCPHCHSTLADDEVEYKEEDGKFYWIKYGPFVLATARPETKLGDTAVAVHPKDKRYKKMIGKKYMIPGVLGEFEVEVVGDEAVDPEFGTGAVKVTPAHSFVDYEIAQRHNIPLKQVINEDGKMMENCGKYAGMTTREAREVIVKDMEKMGLMDHIEDDYKHNLSTCYRCKSVVEPIPSEQWFVDVNKEFSFNQSKSNPIKGLKDGQKTSLKKLMQHVVRKGEIDIIPKRFDKIYFHWIDNLRDWCISRQIWIGHQIPVWYKGKEIYVGVEPPEGSGWEQDPDTLDTWFSSGLWTFSTLGWPNTDSKDLKVFHPTSVLETMFDILFFWVARMIMMSTYALGEVPFETVYLHSRVLDEDGEKMSKSKPETMIDPLDVCKKYGTDAVRLSLLLGVAPGADMRLSEEKIAGFRNFANKLWNICRFMLMNIKDPKVELERPEPQTLADKWILSELDRVIFEANKNIEKFDFSHAGDLLRFFTWDDLADWYLEIAKIEGSKDEILNYILNTLLKLWHPFMPFVTETVWQEIYGKERMLMVEKYPVVEKVDSVVDFGLIKNLVAALRAIRADYKIDPVKKLDICISGGKDSGQLEESVEIIKGLARLDKVSVSKKIAKPEGFASMVVGKMEVFVDLAGVVDLGKERESLEKEKEQVVKYKDSLEKKLSGKEFKSKAPAHVVEQEKKKLEEASEKLDKIDHQLTNLL